MNDESNTPDPGLDAAAEALARLESEEETQEEQEQEEQEEAEETTEEEEAQEEQETATLEELEIDGKKFKVPSELKPYVLRQQDYTRKTQELAEQRRQTSSELAAAQKERSEYAQMLPVVQQFIQMTAPQPPSIELLETNPVEYLQQERLYNQRAQQLQAVGAEYQRVQRVHMENAQREHARLIEEGLKQLPELIPSWRDAKKMAEEQPKVRDYLLEQGFSKEEIATASDPRAVALARKAMLHDQFVKSKSKVTPVKTQTVAPGAKAKTTTADVDRKKAHAALRKSGSVEDAAYLISLLE